MKTKDTSCRIGEVKEIYERLGKIGISRANAPELEPFFESANDFVKEARGSSGTIKLPSVQRVLEYQFASQPGRQTYAVFRIKEKE